MPITTARPFGPLSASSKIPASLPSPQITSFGHLSCTSAPGAHSRERLIEREAGDKAKRRGRRPERRPVVIRRLPAKLPCPPLHSRPRRPRPAGLQRGHDPERAALAGRAHAPDPANSWNRGCRRLRAGARPHLRASRAQRPSLRTATWRRPSRHPARAPDRRRTGD